MPRLGSMEEEIRKQQNLFGQNDFYEGKCRNQVDRVLPVLRAPKTAT